MTIKSTLKRLGIGGASVALVASLTILLLDGTASSSNAASTISGASQAVCEPAPCGSLSGVTSYQLVNVPNGDGTTSTREYAVQRPEGLTPSPKNLAPAVLVFYESGHCGQVLSGRFGSLAAANRFIVVYMEVPCERGDKNWDKRNIDLAESSAVNDEPYVTAVVQDIKQCPEIGCRSKPMCGPAANLRRGHEQWRQHDRGCDVRSRKFVVVSRLFDRQLEPAAVQRSSGVPKPEPQLLRDDGFVQLQHRRRSVLRHRSQPSSRRPPVRGLGGGPAWM